MMSPGEQLAQQYATYLSRPIGAVAEDLVRYGALLLKWNAVQNLVSRETEVALWDRHIADSLQLLPLLRETDRSLLDLGSGGGLPAIPLAICLKGGARSYRLVEPATKKVAFLRTAIRELRLDCTIDPRRSDTIDSRETGPVDVITSRALAGLPLLLALSSPFFGAETRGLFHKGREHPEEVRESRLAWNFDVVIHPSTTDAGGAVLEVSRLTRRLN